MVDAGHHQVGTALQTWQKDVEGQLYAVDGTAAAGIDVKPRFVAYLVKGKRSLGGDGTTVARARSVGGKYQQVCHRPQCINEVFYSGSLVAVVVRYQYIGSHCRNVCISCVLKVCRGASVRIINGSP